MRDRQTEVNKLTHECRKNLLANERKVCLSRQLCVTLTLGEKKKPPGFRVSLDSQLSPETQEDSGMWLPLINPSVIDCPGSVWKCTQTHIYIWRQHAILSPCPLTPVRQRTFFSCSYLCVYNRYFVLYLNCAASVDCQLVNDIHLMAQIHNPSLTLPRADLIFGGLFLLCCSLLHISYVRSAFVHRRRKKERNAPNACT